VLLELEQEFEGSAAAVLSADNVGLAVQERVIPLLRHHYDSFIEHVPGEAQSGATPATYVLVAGYARGVPFIVDIDPHGLIGRYEEVGFGAGERSPRPPVRRVIVGASREPAPTGAD
jgi:proteasome beta subunit